MKIVERLRLLIEDKGYNPKTFAEKIGMAQRTINNYVNGRFPSYEAIHAILHTFPDVSAEWLMRGEGEMYICDGLPGFRGDETEDEENVHVALARCRGKLKLAEEENVRLLGQLEFMEEYNLKLASKYNKLRKEVENIKGEKDKKDII